MVAETRLKCHYDYMVGHACIQETLDSVAAATSRNAGPCSRTSKDTTNSNNAMPPVALIFGCYPSHTIVASWFQVVGLQAAGTSRCCRTCTSSARLFGFTHLRHLRCLILAIRRCCGGAPPAGAIFAETLAGLNEARHCIMYGGLVWCCGLVTPRSRLFLLIF